MKMILLMLVFILTSCAPQNICKSPERINGEVIYAEKDYHRSRTVTMNTNKGIVVIYRVPFEQPLTNIPVCKYHNRYYWVMP